VTVEVTSKPEGGKVLINGKQVGQTPLTHELRTGSYTIKVEREGYKPEVTTRNLVDGDKLAIHAVLYNPVATRFLNARPGLRVDSRQFQVGYRYVFLNNSHPDVEHGHFANFQGALRINDVELGLSLGVSRFVSHQRLDTFLGEKAGDFELDHSILQLMLLFKYPILEKYSFANVKLGLAAGLTYASCDSSARYASKWTGSTDAFIETEVRLARGGNFSLDLLLALGFAYLGELPYLEKKFSPFGEGPEGIRNEHMFGPMASAGLQLKWYNDVF
jgi:hypothetical protein